MKHEHFLKTGERDKGEDYDLELGTAYVKYKRFLEDLNDEKLKERRKKVRQLKKDIDPETGKPRKVASQLQDELSEEEFERFTRAHPELATDRFREYMERRRY